MSAILTEIVSLLTSGITSYATGLGAGINEIVKNLFITTSGTGSDATQSLSVFGGLIIVFASISLVIGLTKLLFNWLTSMGN